MQKGLHRACLDKAELIFLYKPADDVNDVVQVSIDKRIGRERAGPGRTYAFRSLLQVCVREWMREREGGG